MFGQGFPKRLTCLPFVPSLARRVFVALLMAFVIVSIALIVKDLISFRGQFRDRTGWLVTAGSALALSLGDISDSEEAVRAVRIVEKQFSLSSEIDAINGSDDMPPFVFQLGKPAGEILYETVPNGRKPVGQEGEVIVVNLRGVDYCVYASNTERWIVRLGVKNFSPVLVTKLMLVQLFPSLLLAFPLIMIPLWLAVRRGLRPLDLLSEKLAARGENDLSPLAIDTRYAELEKVSSAIENLLMRLRGKIDNERRFIQDAAHELRTPMAVISAQAHVLVHEPSPEGQARARSALDEAIRRASHLSAQLLSLASLDHNALLRRERIDVVALLQELLAQMAPMALARQIDLSLVVPDRLDLEINRVAFISIVHNLLDNALRYGNDHGRIVVSLTSDETQGVMRVADDGPGIELSERERVFDRFYRGKAHKLPGTGLGLAIVEKAVLAMGASIRLDDGLSHTGIAFVVSFPRTTGLSTSS